MEEGTFSNANKLSKYCKDNGKYAIYKHGRLCGVVKEVFL